MPTTFEALMLLLVLGPAVARADWETGEVPEGSTAATIERHAVRLNLIGKSAVGLTDRLELSTYLPLLICPNVGLKYRLVEGPRLAFALEGDLAVGGFPLAAAGVLPLPGGVLGAAGAGVAVGSLQLLEAHLSLKLAPAVTLSVRSGAVAVEGALLGVAVAAGVGGSGAGVVPAALATGTADVGATGGLELDAVLGPRNALMVQADVAGLVGTPVFVLASASWLHAWEHFHLQLGLYTLLAVPSPEPPKVPVAPFINLYWTFNRTPRA